MRWLRNSKAMEGITAELCRTIHEAMGVISTRFGDNSAGYAALGHAIGRRLARGQQWYDNHRADCKECTRAGPRDWRQIFIANMNEAFNDERALIEKETNEGVKVADSFIERVFSSHKNPKAK